MMRPGAKIPDTTPESMNDGLSHLVDGTKTLDELPTDEQEMIKDAAQGYLDAINAECGSDYKFPDDVKIVTPSTATAGANGEIDLKLSYMGLSQ